VVGAKGGDGVLRLSFPGEPRALNPNASPLDEYALFIGQNIFSKLVSLTDDGRVLPDVAEQWSESDDGLSYTFRLRSDVRWHDGRPLTSEDVRSTFAQIATSSNSELAAHVAGVDAVNPTSTGDGIRMALEHGAVVVNGDHMHGPIMRFVPPMRPKLIQRLPPLRWLTQAMRWSFDYLPARLLRPFLMSFLTTALAPSHDLFRRGAILVDKDGLRFADEQLGPDRAAVRRREGMAFIVFDKLVADLFSSWPNFISTAPAVGYAYLDDYRRTRRDIFHRAGTLAELAARMGVPRDSFEKTIADYNAGRQADGASVRGERPLVAVPPFYALGPAKAYIIFTNGGLKVTERLEVVNAAGAIIPRLYAAGSNGQGGMLLEGHGHHLGWAFVSGRLAGRHAALLASDGGSGAVMPNPVS